MEINQTNNKEIPELHRSWINKSIIGRILAIACVTSATINTHLYLEETSKKTSKTNPIFPEVLNTSAISKINEKNISDIQEKFNVTCVEITHNSQIQNLDSSNLPQLTKENKILFIKQGHPYNVMFASTEILNKEDITKCGKNKNNFVPDLLKNMDQLETLNPNTAYFIPKHSVTAKTISEDITDQKKLNHFANSTLHKQCQNSSPVLIPSSRYYSCK